MDSAGKRSSQKGTGARAATAGRVAAANGTVLAAHNDDPGAHGHEQGAKQNERGQTDEKGSGHGMAKRAGKQRLLNKAAAG